MMSATVTMVSGKSDDAAKIHKQDARVECPAYQRSTSVVMSPRVLQQFAFPRLVVWWLNIPKYSGVCVLSLPVGFL